MSSSGSIPLHRGACSRIDRNIYTGKLTSISEICGDSKYSKPQCRTHIKHLDDTHDTKCHIDGDVVTLHQVTESVYRDALLSYNDERETIENNFKNNFTLSNGIYIRRPATEKINTKHDSSYLPTEEQLVIDRKWDDQGIYYYFDHRDLFFPKEILTRYFLSLKTKPFVILTGIS